MKILITFLGVFVAFLVLALLALIVWTRIAAARLEMQFPPIGDYVQVDDVTFHFIDTGRDGLAQTAPTLLFIHGASGNLRDMSSAYKDVLAGQARLIFVDRPGHGYSTRGSGHVGPGGQGRLLGRFLETLDVEKAIVVGHSYGGSVAVGTALESPNYVAGLVAISAPTHPWTTGVEWYHDVTKIPVLGRLFSETLIVPYSVSTDAIGGGLQSVFKPQPVPRTYREETGPDLILRPWHFRSNSADVSALLGWVTENEMRYAEISVPTSIIHGDADDVVSVMLHPGPLSQQIKGSKLIVLPGVGHKPDLVNRDVVLSEITRVAKAAGMPLAN